MNKRIILTSILAISFAMPAMAEITSGATCDTTNLGQSENNSTANVEATWVANRYDVAYRCSSEEVAYESTMFAATYGQPYTFWGSDYCVNEGHTFANWSCVDEDNNITTYTSEQTVAQWNIASDIRCTAQWTANRINIDWDPRNGDEHTVNYCEYGETITLPVEPTKTGYTFGGWIIKPCGSYNTEQTCPSDKCAWNTGTNSCMTMSAYCGLFDSQNTCPNGCKWKTDTNTCMTPDAYCATFDFSSCPTADCHFNLMTETCVEGEGESIVL